MTNKIHSPLKSRTPAGIKQFNCKTSALRLIFFHPLAFPPDRIFKNIKGFKILYPKKYVRVKNRDTLWFASVKYLFGRPKNPEKF